MQSDLDLHCLSRSFWHVTIVLKFRTSIVIKSFLVTFLVNTYMIKKYKTNIEDLIILAHWIRISEILPLDRKSYLTHAILPRLSREGYIHWLYWNSRTLSSSDVIVC